LSIKVKAGVQFDVVAPAGFLILSAMKAVSNALNVPLVITSGTDGNHSGTLDPHKTGEAYDVRSHDFDPHTKAVVLAAMMEDLGRDHFYGVLEGADTPNEHFHFQRRIGTRFTVEDFLNG
jgi:hypothetical protein